MSNTAFGSLFGNASFGGGGEPGAFELSVRAISQSLMLGDGPAADGIVRATGAGAMVAAPRVAGATVLPVPVESVPDDLPFVDLTGIAFKPLIYGAPIELGTRPPFGSEFSWLGDGPGDVGTGDVGWSLLGGRNLPPRLQGPIFNEDISGYTGEGETVVIIDTGNSPFYDDSNTVFEFDFRNDDADATVNTDQSHGAWVAQVAVQVASQVDIIHLKVFGDDGEFAFEPDIEEALQWVVDNKDVYNIAAVNLSLGSGNATEPTLSSLSDEFAELSNAGIFSVVASGNDREDFRFVLDPFFEDGVNYISADPNALSVAATTAGDRFAEFSQRNANLTDIAALGVSIPVATLDGRIFLLDGTSFSAPYVSGIAAVLQDAADDLLGEDLTEDEFLFILRESGRDVIGESDAVPGYRVADAQAAVDYFIENAELFRGDPVSPILDDLLVA